jgi:hypothetical protein
MACSETLRRRFLVKVLSNFFLTKLEDLDTLIPGLKGLLAVSRLSSLLDEEVLAILAR